MAESLDDECAFFGIIPFRDDDLSSKVVTYDTAAAMAFSLLDADVQQQPARRGQRG